MTTQVIGSCEYCCAVAKVEGQMWGGAMSAGTGTGLLQRPRDVWQGTVRLVESFQSDLVSAVVEWLAVSHSSCNGIAVGDVAALRYSAEWSAGLLCNRVSIRRKVEQM